MTEKQVSSCCHAIAFTKITDQGEAKVCFQCHSPFQVALPGSNPTNPEGAKEHQAQERRSRIGNIGCAIAPVAIVASIFLPELRHWLIMLVVASFGLFMVKSLWDTRDRGQGKPKAILVILLTMAMIGAMIYAITLFVTGFRMGGDSGTSCLDRVTQEYVNGELSDVAYNAKAKSECGIPNPILP